MRLIALLLAVTAGGASAQSLVATPNPYDIAVADSLVFQNVTAGPVTVDSLTLASPLKDRGPFFLYGVARIDSPDGPIYRGFECRLPIGRATEGRRCRETVAETIVAGGRMTLLSFTLSCRSVPGGRASTCGGSVGGYADTLQVHVGTETISVAISNLFFVANDPAPPDPRRALTVGPNPATSQATLTLHAPGPVRVLVVDALGREVAVVWDGDAPPGATVTLDVSRWPAGVYAVRAVSAAGVHGARLIVAR